MTDRLYYENSYRTSFDAKVMECRKDNEKNLIRLDRSAFYPTSGGQPYDMGTLDDANILDVFVDAAGEVWHVTDRPFTQGQAVHGSIDWARRFDHMQQHAGEHMLASAIYRLFKGNVIGLHLGAEISSIDAELPGGAMRISVAELKALEFDVNQKIQQNVPIVCAFPDEAVLASMPLRKKPTVDEHIRIVTIGDFEAVACGGTHPSSSGQIGLLKIVDARPSKGKMRVSFKCGMRALADYQNHFDWANAAAAKFSTGAEKLPGAVEAMQEKLKKAEHAVGALRREKLFMGVPGMIANAECLASGVRMVAEKVTADAQLLRELASKLIEVENIAVLLATQQNGSNLYVFARSGDVALDMGALLSKCARANGGKGGGRPEFAQGGGPSQVFEAAKQAIKQDI